MVGGRDFKRQQFNVATQGHRQPGSAFKPFALVAAIEQGMSPQSVFNSAPKTIDMGEGAAPWLVSTYSGGSRVRSACSTPRCTPTTPSMPTWR